MARVPVNGTTLAVTRLPQRKGPARHLGDGTPIVMVHGLAASSAFWYAAGAQFVSLLGPVLMYDLRGHGKSETPETGYSVTNMARDLLALLDAEGVERAHLVSHSFGGMICLAFALAHPDRVASLTLVDVRVRPIQRKLSIPARQLPPAVERRLASLGLDIAAINTQDDGIHYLKTVARIEVEAGEEAVELLNALYRHPRLFRNRRAAERWITLTERVSLIADLEEEEAFTARDLAQLSLPMLILVGGNSTTVPSAQELARLCPHAILREIPDVGHFFPMSQPRLFLQPTLRFLRALETGRLAGPRGRAGLRPDDDGRPPAR